MLAEQIYTFILATVGGMGLGIGYDLYRTLIKSKRTWWRPVTDFLIWIVGAGLFFLLLLWGHWGEVRSFLFVGLGVGFLIYFRWLSAEVRAFWEGMISLLTFIIVTLINAFLWPFRITGKMYAALKKRLANLYLRKIKPIGSRWRQKGSNWLRPAKSFKPNNFPLFGKIKAKLQRWLRRFKK